MISAKVLGVALLFVGLLGVIKLLFDLVEKNRRL
jgi:preprotein translocase subunit Sss1